MVSVAAALVSNDDAADELAVEEGFDAEVEVLLRAVIVAERMIGSYRCLL